MHTGKAKAGFQRCGSPRLQNQRRCRKRGRRPCPWTAFRCCPQSLRRGCYTPPPIFSLEISISLFCPNKLVAQHINRTSKKIFFLIPFLLDQNNLVYKHLHTRLFSHGIFNMSNKIFRILRFFFLKTSLPQVFPCNLGISIAMVYTSPHGYC